MNKLMEATLTPAYGRDYKSKADAIKDFYARKDFTLHHMAGVTYCSVSDFADGATIRIRYKKMTQVAVLKVNLSEVRR